MVVFRHLKCIPIVAVVLTFLFFTTMTTLSFFCTKVAAQEISAKDINDMLNNSSLDDEFQFLAEEQSVSIASRTEEKVTRAPSVVTVITAEEIENMGLNKLYEVLKIIPGFDSLKDGAFGLEIFGVRGTAVAIDKTRVLLDGHSLNIPATGDSVWYFDDLSLKNVKRIEVIRGPGSALYGANAYLAVINIITKDGNDIDGVEVSGGFGSYDAQDYNILYGKEIYGVDVSGYVNLYNSNGQSDTIEADSISEASVLRFFSLAPGDTDDGRKKADINLKMAYKNLEFRAKYLDKNTESFIGPSLALTNDTDQRYNYVMGDLRYSFDIGKRLTVRPRIYYDQYDRDLFLESLPDGTTIPVDLDFDGDIESFPDGRMEQSFMTNRILGSEIRFEYEVLENNLFTFGFDYEWEKQGNVQFHTNFNPLTGAALDSFQNVSETANWSEEVTRQIWAVYFQDKWDITDKMAFTFGVRHDHYSDFEGTTNPRIGFVWDFIDNATLKLLYGQAFRAPDFGELYTTNNPNFAGNPDLQPETIRTYEVMLAYRFTKSLGASINYFFNAQRDIIELVPKTDPNLPFQRANSGSSDVQGGEFELRNNFGNGNYAFANYTLLDTKATGGENLPFVARHKGNIGVNFGLSKYLNANLHTFITGKRMRQVDDERDYSPGYAVLNLTLMAKNFFNDMKITASLFNLLDKEYTTPTNPLIPNDMPRPGRTFFVELGYDF